MADGKESFKNKKRFNNSFDPGKQSTHVVRKRCPPRIRQKNDLFITSKSNFMGQLSQCEKLISEGEDEIILHGIGAAIARTINLALQFSEKHQGAFELHVETSTVTLVDDLEPLHDSEDFDSRTRHNSAVKIRIVKNKDCPVNQV